MSDEKLSYPSLRKQAENLGISLSKLLMRALNGDRVRASREVSAERYKICQGCEKYDLKQDRCVECGCVARFKVMPGYESCPIGKWTEDETEFNKWIDSGAPDRAYDDVDLPFFAEQDEDGNIFEIDQYGNKAQSLTIDQD